VSHTGQDLDISTQGPGCKTLGERPLWGLGDENEGRGKLGVLGSQGCGFYFLLSTALRPLK
jgi:hypothetical protein